MANTIHLVRHGHHALLGRLLCGRMPGVELDELGCRQIALCAELISPEPTIVQSSPQLRARQSATILAERFGLPVEIVPEMDEIDLGDWTSASFVELVHDPCWNQWNAQRGASCPPNGESMRSLQTRVVSHLERLVEEATDGTIVIVSHAEPIRAALLHYLRIPLDDFRAVEIGPASISTLVHNGRTLGVTRINQEVPA
ncbi:MAG: histidine phosphatase family protein [Bradyrhizobium sp.]|uniref:histidine phosphatase family protein n=1 Tax=Bradyrhizobium sp. TaxID=376 RepID=UPI0025C6F0AD|nr:histidine phosphatase family protein [Bradyrhizobium sp.]MBI5264699.1 histidine phosphatase family protein [Bradyrhizobium sp.]